MKLSELMEAQVMRMLLGNIPFIKRTDTTSPVNFRQLRLLGTGVEADVYGATKAGHVVKVLRFPKGFSLDGLQNNPYLHFVSMCLRNQSNPYFPKIKSAKVYEIPFGKDDRNREDEMFIPQGHAEAPSDFMLIIVLEALKELDEVNMDEAEEVFNAHGMTLDAVKAEEDKKARGKKKALLSIRSLGMKPKNLKRVMSNTDNPEFHEALNKLAPLFKKFGGDTHSGNLMFRPVGGGYQLVFTDPLYPEENI